MFFDLLHLAGIGQDVKLLSRLQEAAAAAASATAAPSRPTTAPSTQQQRSSASERRIRGNKHVPASVKHLAAAAAAAQCGPLDLSLKGSDSGNSVLARINNESFKQHEEYHEISMHEDHLEQQSAQQQQQQQQIHMLASHDQQVHNPIQQVTTKFISSSTSPSSCSRSISSVSSVESARDHARSATTLPSKLISGEMISSSNQLQTSSIPNKRQKHKSLKSHLCQQCGRAFSRSDMLTRHSRLHSGLKPYQCGKCKQVFSRSDHLSTHERTHTGEKPYQCEQCAYSACRRDMITRHMRTHAPGNHQNSGQLQHQLQPITQNIGFFQRSPTHTTTTTSLARTLKPKSTSEQDSNDISSSSSSNSSFGSELDDSKDDAL